MKRIFPPSFYNPLTLAGSALAAVSFGLILFLVLLESLARTPRPYMGIIAFVLLPAVMLIGLGIAVAGVMREHRRERKGKPHGMHLPQIDLNNPRHRVAFTVVSVGAILLLLFSAFGSYKAYEYTDSDEFCGEVCHAVMEPEYTAYQYSPHARVGCAKCHIGPGADWFVRSKISGAYQVYSVLFNRYPRPIPTPISNLRPAQETCEQCHWPKHFYAEKLFNSSYYLTDDENTRWNLAMTIRIGGGNIEAGPTSGIHWHMNIANEVLYAAVDTQRQVIPWVQVKDSKGAVTVYRSTDITIDDDSLRRLETRRMDCIDCHNRPTHIYQPPARAIDHLMSLGWIDHSLPGIKSIALTALDMPYSSKEAALDSIRIIVEEHFRADHPQVADAKKELIERAVTELQKIYSRSYFPAMHVSWKGFTNNIGHMYYPGCFRCHDGKHVSAEGKSLSRDCNTCHVILAQQFEQDTIRVSLTGIDYRHPVDIGDAWRETNCSDCHNGQ